MHKCMRARHQCLSATRHLAQIPEQARHDAERFFGDRQQDVLVGRMLGAAGIGMRHPDRRQAKPSENTSFGSEPPKFGSTAGALPVVCRIDSAAQLIQGLSKSVREAAKLCVALHLDHRKSVGVQMRPDGVDDLVDLVPTTKRSCSTACALSRNGVGRLLDIAGRHRQHFERIPGIEPLGRRQALLAPVLRQRRLVRRRLDLDVGKRGADLVGNAAAASARPAAGVPGHRPASRSRWQGWSRDWRARRPNCRNDARPRADSTSR